MTQYFAHIKKKMKKEIESREELEEFLKAFYKKAFTDELIGHFFTEVVPLDLTTHIPGIAGFWESWSLIRRDIEKM